MCQKYDSCYHQIDLIVNGSDVIIDDVTRCWDYRRERPNFRVPFAQFLCASHLVRVTKRMWWNFMWLYLIRWTLNDLMWPLSCHVMSIEVWMSLAKNRSVIGSLTVTQTPSIRIKTSLIESKHQRSSQNPLIGWNFDQWELGSSETLFTGSKIDEPRLFMWLSSWPNLTFYGVYRVYMRIVFCLVH